MLSVVYVQLNVIWSTIVGKQDTYMKVYEAIIITVLDFVTSL